MYEVRISNIARYMTDRDASAPLTADGHTIALYRFDEGSGDVLNDSSGNRHHGKIVGAKRVKTEGSTISPLSSAQTPLPSTFKNGIGMEFVKVPKGKSWLRSGSVSRASKKYLRA
jgi:hypothetical protein